MNLLNLNIKSLFDWKAIILIIALLFMISMQCNQNDVSSDDTIIINKKKYQVKKQSRDTTYIPKGTIEYKPGAEIYTTILEYDTIPKYIQVDTAAILKDYFSKVLSIDTLNLSDSMGYVIIKDTITQNRILGRTYTADINQMVIYDTNWIAELPKAEWYFGTAMSISKDRLPNQLGISALYKNKKNNIYTIGLGLQNGNNVTPYVSAAAYWKIKFTK